MPIKKLLKAQSIVALMGAFLFLISPGLAAPQDDLLQAVQNGDLVRLKQALDQDASINDAIYLPATFSSSTTALVLAVQNRHLKLVRMLLEHGADPNLEKDSWSPLQAGVCNDDLSMVKSVPKSLWKVRAPRYSG
jgi:ankyrin repeat protein